MRHGPTMGWLCSAMWPHRKFNQKDMRFQMLKAFMKVPALPCSCPCRYDVASIGPVVMIWYKHSTSHGTLGNHPNYHLISCTLMLLQDVVSVRQILAIAEPKQSELYEQFCASVDYIYVDTGQAARGAYGSADGHHSLCEPAAGIPSAVHLLHR